MVTIERSVNDGFILTYKNIENKTVKEVIYDEDINVSLNVALGGILELLGFNVESSESDVKQIGFKIKKESK